MVTFEPDFRFLLKAAQNIKPERLPAYEHAISPKIMERVLNRDFAALESGDRKDVAEFFRYYCEFFMKMTYDTVSYEVCITDILPDHGAILGGKPGPIQNRVDFEKYPWEELPDRFWKLAEPKFNALQECLPVGMKAVGGVGNGVFEISEDLVGMEYLAYMQIDDLELFQDLYIKIGDLVSMIWKRFLKCYSQSFAVCRFGDDLGFRNGTLVSPQILQKHVFPQYKKVISLIKGYGKPFLWHSCGCIFDVMEDVIELGINAKHSNEDAIAPFDEWIRLYGSRIGLFGGIDVDTLCRLNPDDVFKKVLEDGTRFLANTNGFALGSGNSIPDYVPVDAYLAMISAIKRIRQIQ